MNEIAVLITCHNRKAKTLACLEALYQNELPEGYSFDVFLVDDGSTDGTGEAVRANYPTVTVIQGNGNLYWNRGMHLAWETAAKTKEYDFYLWLNDDTLLKKNALSMLLKGDRKDITIGTTINEKVNQLTYGGFDKENRLIEPEADKFTICDYFNGNIVLIPRRVFEKVGFNDNRFHHALGDFDYGLRARKAGFELMVAPGILGYCEAHDRAPKWRNTELPVFKRLIELYKPLGNNPFEFFVFDYRHNGLFNAIMHFFSIHLRTIYPSLWK